MDKTTYLSSIVAELNQNSTQRGELQDLLKSGSSEEEVITWLIKAYEEKQPTEGETFMAELEVFAEHLVSSSENLAASEEVQEHSAEGEIEAAGRYGADSLLHFLQGVIDDKVRIGELSDEEKVHLKKMAQKPSCEKRLQKEC